MRLPAPIAGWLLREAERPVVARGPSVYPLGWVYFVVSGTMASVISDTSGSPGP
jgi:hypothetical protein